MNRWDVQQNAMVGSEEMRGSVSVNLSLSDLKGPVVCPKPRRVGFLANHPSMSLRWCKRSIQGEQLDSKARAELLDMILTKDGYGVEPSPPPFFQGSPPTRVSNPIVQDAIFKEEKLSPLSTLQMLPSSGSASPSPSPLSPSARKGGCVRMKYGLKPAAVRVEGFDCLSRDRQNSGITAVA